MRWRFAVLISVLLLGQIHLCRVFYVTPDGQECPTCSAMTHKPVSSGIGEAHGDCHDCCVLKACDRGNTLKAKPAVWVSDAFYLESPVIFSLPTIELFFQGITHIESAPTHGPPVLSGSRGPPCFQLA